MTQLKQSHFWSKTLLFIPTRNRIYYRNHYTSLTDEIRNEFREKIKVFFKKESTDKDVVENILKNLEKALGSPNLLTVFRLESDEEGRERGIDMAILHSLLKAKQTNFKAQVELALTWDRIDIAKDFIFSQAEFWEVRRQF